jgi:predicted HAD superfamily Cof-like phosphohydrolase
MTMEKDEIHFTIKDQGDTVKLLTLTKEGMYYKGQLVKDEGAALEAFKTWLSHAMSESGDMFSQVAEFHRKFDLQPTDGPAFPVDELVHLKLRHLQEELDEVRAGLMMEDLEKFFDGLIDLVYVALGTAYLSGLPFNQGFSRVHAANMQKVRAVSKDQSKRGSTYDIVKPAGWVPPELSDLLRKEKE